MAWAVVSGKAGWADQAPKRSLPRNRRSAGRFVQAGSGSTDAKAFWGEVLS